MKRLFLIVLDSFGIGAAPDAKKYKDDGANTLMSVYKTGRLNIKNLLSLGLGNIDGVDMLEKTNTPLASHGRLAELSAGKDTTTGHFEIMGIVSENPMPTYPEGFPKEIIDKFEKESGYGTLCNLPYSGTDVIRDFGEEHLKSGKLIVYTSADSVFQIAAHEDIISTERLYDVCRIARKILVGEHTVGRVIARPFTGTPGNFKRTPMRRDFSCEPPSETVLDILKESGKDVIGVGKIGDIFAMKGLTESYPTHSNAEGMAKTLELSERDFDGLCFVNLVDFDMNYGHRQDAAGYADALSEFDLWLGSFIEKLTEDDTLIICADHGCDPSDASTDHTREYIPWLVYNKNEKAENLGTQEGFYKIGERVLQHFGIYTEF